MDNLWMPLSAWLATAGFATLLAAYTVTAEAGLERLASKAGARADRVRSAAGKWDRLRAALMLCTAGSLVLTLGTMLDGQRWTAPVWLIALIAAPALALLLHVFPRALAESYADRLSVALLPAVSALALVLLPLAGPLAALERYLMRHLLARLDARHRPTPEDEIISLVDQAEGHDLEHEEREIIRSVFEFGSTVAREIMTPRVQMTAFESATPIAEAVPVIATSGYSRYPVFEESIDRIAGIAHARDLLLAAAEGGSDAPIHRRIKPACYVPETMPISEVLKLLRSRRQHLAVVVDEYGGTAGLVTMEDVLEELIGEIRDEFDTDEHDLEAPAGNAAVFDAATSIDTVNEAMAIEIPDEDHYDSIGGYIMNELGHIPEAGECLAGNGFRITVEDASERRIRRVRVERVPDRDPSP